MFLSTFPTPIIAAATPATSLPKAQQLNQQGVNYLAQGQAAQALAAWQQAYQLYRQAQDPQGMIGTQINQAQALQSLGYYRQALDLLNTLQPRTLTDKALQAQGLLSSGNLLRSLRQFDRATAALIQARYLTQNDTALLTLHERIRLSLAHTYAQKSDVANNSPSISNTDIAINEYRNIINTATDPLIKAQAQIHLYRLAPPSAQNTPTLISEIRSQLDRLPASRAVLYAYINLAQATQARYPQSFTDKSLLTATADLLTTAHRRATALGDRRSQIQALGSLGNLYQKTGQYPAAQKLTIQAITLAEGLPAPDLAYQLQWQLGKILTTTQNRQPAIAAYQQALTHLQQLRNDLSGSDSDIQFSFRESVEPVYREMVSLLLPADGSATPNQLTAAQEAIESLQTAEVQNLLRQGCLDVYPVSLQQRDITATVIYPIILPDRLVTITAYPNPSSKPNLTYYTTSLKAEQVKEIVDTLQAQITNAEASPTDIQATSRQLYQALIAPLRPTLDKKKISTLVFVLDGALRKLPIAVLHDGSRYLFEDYNLALAPSLSLVPPASKESLNYHVFLGGLSKASPKFPAFPPLPNVATELQAISHLLPTQILLDEQFNQQRTTNILKTGVAPIVHLATHGEFSSDPDKTFLLAWDTKLKLADFDPLLRRRNQQSGIELLVLSACSTATGDDRATLGLAGMAIRARTRSTLASLWQVDDQATEELMTAFYQGWIKQKYSKAEALRLAQKQLLQKNYPPYKWAAFVLVGNWQ